jgi:hypothetical protein
MFSPVFSESSAMWKVRASLARLENKLVPRRRELGAAGEPNYDFP